MNKDQLTELRHLEADYEPSRLVAGDLRRSARYAVLLLERAADGDVVRAGSICEALMALQADEPSATIHGQFPMHLAGPVGDLNAALFLMPALLEVLALAPARLPAPLTADFNNCVGRATIAVERRWDEERFDLNRDFKAYTNVFLLYIQALLLAGNHYGDARLQRKATAQWQRWFNHVSYYGIDELSPSYSNVDYGALTTIRQQSPDAQVRREAVYVLEHLSALYHAITHPRLRLPVCGSFRDYRRFLTETNCEPDLVRQETRFTHATAAVRQDYENRTYPYVVRGRSTTMPFRFQSWQEKHASMGTMTGGNYFWQQIHCMVAVGNSETERAVLFMPGAFTPTSGFVAQQAGTALCVFCREPNRLHRTQYPMPDRAVHDYQQMFGIGVSGNWHADTSEDDNIVFSAYGYDIHIQPFEIRDGDLRPVRLTCKRLNDMGQEGFHHVACEFDMFVFPAAAVLFGCIVEVRNTGEARAPAGLSCTGTDARLTVSVDHPNLSVRLFKQPSGELTELYADDWRTVPLLQSPAHTLYPGELTRRAAQ